MMIFPSSHHHYWVNQLDKKHTTVKKVLSPPTHYGHAISYLKMDNCRLPRERDKGLDLHGSDLIILVQDSFP